MVTKREDLFIRALTAEERLQAFADKQILVFDDPTIVEADWFNGEETYKKEAIEDKLKWMGVTKEEYAFVFHKYCAWEVSVLAEYLENQPWFQIVQKISRQKPADIPDAYMLVHPWGGYLDKMLAEIKTEQLVLKDGVLAHVKEYILEELQGIMSVCFEKELELEFQKFEEEGEPLEEFRLRFGKSPKLWMFYEKYPVLVRIMTEKMMGYQEILPKIIRDMDENWKTVQETFDIQTSVLEDIQVLEKKPWDWDSIYILKFQGEKEFVYKTNQDVCEKAFHEFLGRLNTLPGILPYEIPKVLYMEAFTLEYLPVPKDCKEEAEVKEYYRYLGQLMAITGILHGTDYECRNVVAYGKQPYVIDYNTIFAHYYGTKYSEWNEIPMGKSELFVCTPLMQYEAVWDEERNQKFLERNNGLTWNGRKTEVDHYKEDVYTGYAQMLEGIEERKEQVIGWVRELFWGFVLKQPIRDMALYLELIYQAQKAEYMADMLSLGQLLDYAYSFPKELDELVHYEIEELKHFRIPVFCAEVDEKCLQTRNGEKTQECYAYSALHKVLAGLERMDKKGIETEKKKLYIKDGAYWKLLQHKFFDLQINLPVKQNYTKEELTNICLSIAQDITKDCLFYQKGENLSWWNISEEGELTDLQVMKNGLLDGKAGVLCYLALAARMIPDSGMEGWVSKLETILDKYTGQFEESVFAGQSSVIYAKEVLERPVRIDSLKKILRVMERNQDHFTMDWFHGELSYLGLFSIWKKRGVDMNLMLPYIKRLLDRLTDIVEHQDVQEKVWQYAYAFLLGEELGCGVYQEFVQKMLARYKDRQLSVIDASFMRSCFSKTYDLKFAKFVSFDVATKERIMFNRLEELGQEMEYYVACGGTYFGSDEMSDKVKQSLEQMITWYQAGYINEIEPWRNYRLDSGRTGLGYHILRAIYADAVPNLFILEV